jgi:hypothetical protein
VTAAQYCSSIIIGLYGTYWTGLALDFLRVYFTCRHDSFQGCSPALIPPFHHHHHLGDVPLPPPRFAREIITLPTPPGLPLLAIALSMGGQASSRLPRSPHPLSLSLYFSLSLLLSPRCLRARELPPLLSAAGAAAYADPVDSSSCAWHNHPTASVHPRHSHYVERKSHAGLQRSALNVRARVPGRELSLSSRAPRPSHSLSPSPSL